MTKRKPTLIRTEPVNPAAARGVEASVTTVTASQFTGPLPPPAMLAQYNDVVPGAAERIIAMAEKQQAHRHDLEASVVRRNLDAQVRGQRMAFGIGLAVIIGGFVLIGFGKNAYGIAAVVAALTSLVAVFVTGRVLQARERREKRQQAETNKG